MHEKDASGGIEFDLVARWLWQFLNNYETIEEADHVLHLLGTYLNEKDNQHHGWMGGPLKEAVANFVSNSFVPLRSCLFFHEFIDHPMFDNMASLVAELENRAFKHSAGGIRPRDSLDITEILPILS